MEKVNTNHFRSILQKMEDRNNTFINYVTKISTCIGALVFIAIITFIIHGFNSGFSALIISAIGSLFTFLVGAGVLFIYIIKELNICSHQCDVVTGFLIMELYNKVETSLDELECTNKMNINDLKSLLPTFKNKENQ